MPRPFIMPKTGIPFKPTKSAQTLVREAISGAGPGVKKPRISGADAVTAGVGDGAGFLSNWKDALMTGASMAGKAGAVITGAAALGQMARPHVEKLPKAGSGRGAGRTTFRDSNNDNKENANAAGDSTVTSPSARPQASGTKITVDGKQYDTGYHSQEIRELRNQNPGGGNAAQSQSTDPAKSSFIPATGRDVERQSPAGVVQKGTSTSPKPMTMDDANKLLSGGYKVEDPYAGTQLPYTQTSPYSGKGNAEIYNPDTLHQHDSDVDYVSLSKDIYGDQSGVELSTRNGGMKTDYKQMDVNPGEKAPEEKVNWANRTMADNSDEKVRRRSAFLDPNVNIMQAMRNQEAIQGRVYAGGKHYQRNKDAGQEGQNDFVEISADQARDRSYYRQSADEVFANHLGKAKDTVASGDIPDLPKDAPAPLPDAVPGNTDIDKSQLDTSDLMDMNPSESIIGNNTPSRTVKKGTLFNRQIYKVSTIDTGLICRCDFRI